MFRRTPSLTVCLLENAQVYYMYFVNPYGSTSIPMPFDTNVYSFCIRSVPACSFRILIPVLYLFCTRSQMRSLLGSSECYCTYSEQKMRVLFRDINQGQKQDKIRCTAVTVLSVINNYLPKWR